MCAESHTTCPLALLLPLDAIFVNKLQKNILYYNTHSNIFQYLSNKVTISRYRERDLQSIMSDAQLFLQPQILAHKGNSIVYKNIFFDLSA